MGLLNFGKDAGHYPPLAGEAIQPKSIIKWGWMKSWIELILY